MQQIPPEPPVVQKKTNVALIVVIVVLAMSCCIVPILAAVIFPVFSQARFSAKRTAEMVSARKVAMTVLMYSADYDDRMPPAFSTPDDLRSTARMYGAPSALFALTNPRGGEFMPNSGLAGMDLKRVVSPQDAVLFYESEPWDSRNGHIAAFLDGHVKYTVPFDPIQDLRFATTGESP